MRRTLLRMLLIVLVFLLGQPISRAQFAPDELEEDSPYASGVVSRLKDFSHATQQIFLPTTEDSSPRSWEGYLESNLEGNYRLAARFVGELEIQLNGHTVLKGSSQELQWLASDELPLPYAHHPIRVTLKPTADGRSGITTFWSGPNFRFEPLPPKVLWHDKNAKQLDTSGHTLFRKLRCDSCHSVDGLSTEPLRSPTLKHITPVYTNPRWLETFFDRSSKSEDPIIRIHGGLPDVTADELIGWLKYAERPAPVAATEGCLLYTSDAADE